MSLDRLHQIVQHLGRRQPTSSILHGATDIPLLNFNLSELICHQSQKYGPKTALVCYETGERVSYLDLENRSHVLANRLLTLGINKGDRLAIMSGNCAEYVDLIFAAGRVGAILAVINNTYTPDEFHHALNYIDCKVLFISSRIGNRDNTACIEILNASNGLPCLEKIILLNGSIQINERYSGMQYKDLIDTSVDAGDKAIEITLPHVDTHDVCNLQFTSGTTGKPKAAMLTHHNIINNAMLIGQRMSLNQDDVLCCPPPLYHCFGLVLGLLACITHGCTIVFPGANFEAQTVINAVIQEKCTALHGVPAMWVAELKLIMPGQSLSHLRTGIAAGSGTPRPLMEELREKMNLTELTNTYGMTETSPASFMTSCKDPLERRLSTVGKILPHTSAKIIDNDGNIVPVGHKGQLCVSGYLLQKGYWKNAEKTREVMIPDADGVMWMHTGDEASFDSQGYCKITGRIKDIIIRGGENIFPLEIEERLIQHPAIAHASVVGIKDEKYGEVVGAFLESQSGKKTHDAQIQRWVGQTLGRHKIPKHIFWIGDSRVGNEYPLTGSGKIKKNVLRELGHRILRIQLSE